MSDESKARVCVPVCVRSAGELRSAAARAAEFADFVEIRFDCLEAPELGAALRDFGAIAEAAARPLVLTFRPEAEGGRRGLETSERLAFWSDVRELLSARADATHNFADVELELLASEHSHELSKLGEALTLICSHHDFAGTPEDLGRVYEAMARTPAGVFKIAVRANRITDCVEVLKVLARARAEGRELIAVAMGEAGLLTRVLGPSRGSFLTYGALDDEQATAPGQATARQLRELYRIGSISGGTRVMGVVGSPVMHSLSPHIHNASFAARALDAVFLPFEVVELDAFVRRMVDPRTRGLDWNLRGLSVTAPHKTDVMKYLDSVEPRAREVGAVNTVVVEGEELHGYNTDAAAALLPLDGLVELRGASVAVLGAGGAARALLWGLREAGARATVFARDGGRARAVAEEFGADVASLEGARFGDFELVVNSTPLGTKGAKEGETPATAAQLRGARVAYDLVYNPAETLFLREARAAGCDTLGGLAMLVAQAGAQFKLWTGEEPPLDVMRAAAEKQMSDAGC